MSYELGEFSFRYRSLAVHGFGISASSNFAVLYQAMHLFFEKGAPVIRDELAARALEFDRRQANGLFVAADDVYPIVHGGVVAVQTTFVPKPTMEKNGVSVQAVKHDPRWLADHVVIAFQPHGKRHDVKHLLEGLYKHKLRRTMVRRISDLAEKAAAAIEKSDLSTLANCVTQYRNRFSDWTENQYINDVVAELADKLKWRFKDAILSWKPPGAGASEAIAVFTRDTESRNAVIHFLESLQWWASPLIVSTGICGEFIHHDGHRRITAGHRLDFVGAADLGQSPEIRETGLCLSCAIEPRSEILLEGPVKRNY